MSFLQSIILGIIQGLTEFLPVSSSAHLVLVPYLLDWHIPESQVFPFDVLVQIGTLLAVIIYFWKDLWAIVKGFFQALIRRKPFETPEARMGWYLILATIPAGLTGVLLKDRVEAAFNNPRITAIFLFVTALFLLGAEFFSRRSRKLEQMNWIDALVAGIFQAFSIFPGVSRSGSTITGGMLRHLDRPAAARFAFLMSIPVMLAAGLFSVPDLLDVPNLGEFLPILIIGFIVAAVVGYFSIHWLLSFLNKRSLIYFAAYCVLLGSVVLIVSHFRPSFQSTTASPSLSTAALSAQKIDHVILLNTTAATDWLIPTSADCASGLPGLALLTASDSGDLAGVTTTSIDLRWGEPETVPALAVTVTEDQLSFIVHPENKLKKLPAARLNQILAGTIKTWNDLWSSCPKCFFEEPSRQVLDQTIQLYRYADETDVQNALVLLARIPEIFPGTAVLVPSTVAMNQAVLADPAALGFLPSQAVDPDLRPINLTDGNQVLTDTQPILAMMTAEPEGVTRAWLSCLVMKMGEN